MLDIPGPHHRAGRAGRTVRLIQHMVNIPVHRTVVKGMDVRQSVRHVRQQHRLALLGGQREKDPGSMTAYCCDST